MGRHAHPLGGLLLVALVSACGGPETFHYVLYLRGFPEAMPLYVELAGRPQTVRSQGDGTRVVSVDVPASVRLTTPGTLRVSADGLCGPHVIALRRTTTLVGSWATEDAARRSGETIEMDYWPATIPRLAQLVVDARSAGEARVEIGEARARVGAGAVRAFDVVDATCPFGDAIRIDGTEVGRFQPAGGVRSALVNLDAARCYRTREVRYVALVLSALDDGPGPHVLERLDPARFHPLGSRVDFVMRSAPNRIELDSTRDDDTNALRVELVQADCPTPL